METPGTTCCAPVLRRQVRRRGRVDAKRGHLAGIAGVPCLAGESAADVQRFAEGAFPACVCPPAPEDVPALYEKCTPVFYIHHGAGFRIATPAEILRHAQHLISRRFCRNEPLVDQVDTVRAILHLQLAGHLSVVFAALLLDRRLRLIDYVEIFRGSVAEVVVHPREVVREALRRNATGVIIARNDPTGDGQPSDADFLDIKRLRAAFEYVEIRLLDYLIVGQRITSLAERGML